MIVPVISFNGNCSEAMDFYEEVFGATDIFKQYYRDAPDDSGLPKTDKFKNLIMHAGMKICGTEFNMSDSDVEGDIVPGNMHRFNVFMDSEDAVKNAFEKLKANGTVVVDIGPQFFSPMYGSVIDNYGIHWQIICSDSI